MLKRILISVFAGMVLGASMAASAVDNKPAENMKSSLSIESGIVNKEFVVQAANNNDQIKSSTSKSLAADESEPILPTGWLLTLALFGFVMLSNRRGV